MKAGQGGEDGLEQPDGGDGQLHGHRGATGKQSWSATSPQVSRAIHM